MARYDGTRVAPADSAHLVTGSWDNTARLWELATGRELTVFKGHTGPVYSLALSADGAHLVTGSDDNTAPSHAIRDRLAKADPGNAGRQRDLAVSHNNIGNMLRASRSCLIRDQRALVFVVGVWVVLRDAILLRISTFPRYRNIIRSEGTCSTGLVRGHISTRSDYRLSPVTKNLTGVRRSAGSAGHSESLAASGCLSSPARLCWR